jgi:YD repeat-containing protein
VTWTYDDSYQLTREQRAGATSYDTTFVYDAVGNRTLQVDSGARTTYTYDAANQLITENSGTVMTYTFDGDGNLAGRLYHRSSRNDPLAIIEI